MCDLSNDSLSPDARDTAADLERLLTEIRYVTSHARCLLWHGTVFHRGGGRYDWQIQVFDEAAAQAFMPLELRPDETYPQAWYRHRLLEGQRLCDQLSHEALQTDQLSYSAEFGCRAPDGSVRWFAERVYVEPLAPPSAVGAGPWRVVGVAIDITDRKQAEEALRRANQEKDEFLAMLAHELRNPLGAMRSALEVIERTDPEQDAYGRALAAAKRQVELQTRIVSDLLDVSRLARGRFQLQREPVELCQPCRHAVDDFRPVAEAAGLTLTLDLPAEPVWLRGDPARLAQVLVNLLDNAAKFTDPGGRISVRLVKAESPESTRRHGNTEGHKEGDQEEEGVPAAFAPPGSPFPSRSVSPCLGYPRQRLIGSDRAVLTVTDTGCGIAPELLPHVFTVFAQAEQALDRGRSGLGLGLALVKGLVELHGGSVTASSAGPGQGAVFTIRLPVHGGKAAPGSQLPAADDGSWELGSGSRRSTGSREPARRILLIEDHRDAAGTLRDLLELWGYQVDIAAHGRAGLDAARAAWPDLILCDIGLPGMDGYAVARELRRDPSLAAIPLIAVTGYAQEEDRRRAARAGFDHHLAKPVDAEELHRLLASLTPTPAE
jgi:signal transduction histidine kinase/CheY-like chemotaxis protein